MESELLASPINEFSLPFDKYNAPYAKYAFRIWSQNNQGLGPKPKCKVSFYGPQLKKTLIIGPTIFHQLLEPLVFIQIYLQSSEKYKIDKDNSIEQIGAIQTKITY